MARGPYAEATPHYRLDEPPALLEAKSSADGRSPPLTQASRGGGQLEDASRAYTFRNGRRLCLGVRAVVALDDPEPTAGYVLVAGSHTAEVAAPSEFLARGADALEPSDELLLRPPLRAGDVLLHASTLVHGVRADPACQQPPSYVTMAWRTDDSSQNISQSEEPEAPPAWVAELTPTQQAALGWHPSGASGEMAADAALMSDGHRSWVSPAGQALRREERDAEERARHPGVFFRDPSTQSLIDDMELYRWDTAGHIVLRGVMDEEWIQAARAAIASLPTTHTDRVPAEHIQGSYFAGMTGGTGFELPPGAAGGLCGLPTPHNEPFLRMLDHPPIVQRLQWMMGAGWTMNPPGLTSARQGQAGLPLHVGGSPSVTSNLINFRRGVHSCHFINMAWQLQDVNVGGQRDGGYICIPGSHRASLSLPHSDYVASWMAEGARPRSFEDLTFLLISRALDVVRLGYRREGKAAARWLCR